MTAAIVPAPQHMRALDRAQRIRDRRSTLRRDIAAGRRSVLDALTDESCRTARVAEVLAWQDGWGARRAEQLLEKHEICSPFLRTVDLTDRQVQTIARALGVRS